MVNDANPHVSNIGRMVEDMEFKLRTTIETIYFGKTKDIVSGELRQLQGAGMIRQRQNVQKQIGASMGRG